ncbi:hypothetical protein N0V84_003626 [Fusarium piperis]|uniref:Clr5 domain-containing protein n=1 Tax=Fusarium piperis TaxID=1435070 RepID=A0A9W8WH66_9HYPO|nr:hypothetical protein N0V84_003626 [Fusarium piperis]
MSSPAHNASDDSPNSDEAIAPTRTESSMQLGAPSAPKRYALPIDWDQHKEKIRQLYLDEDKTLAKVMEIMTRDHGHNGRYACPATDVEMVNAEAEGAVDQPFQPADGAGYDIDHLFRPADAGCGIIDIDHPPQALDDQDADDQYTQPATVRRAVQHLFAAEARRAVQDFFAADARRVAHDSFQAADANTSADNEEDWQLSVHRRQSLTLSQAVGIVRSTTPPMSVAERIFSLAQRHVETSFSYGIWRVNDNNACTSQGCTEEDMDLPETYFDLVRSAGLLLEQGSTTEGLHVLSKAFTLVKPIIKSGNVRALNFFWTSLIFLVQFGHTRIVVALIKYIYDMAKILLHPEHPVVQMFKLLTRVKVAELESLVHNTWQITADAFQKQLPKLHPEYVRHQCDLIFRVYGRLRDLLKDCQDTAQAPELSRMTVLNALGYNFMNSKDWVKAVNIGQEIEERAQLARDIDLLVYQIGGMEIQARAFNEMKLIMPAVRCLKQATPLIAEKWGEGDPWRIELMTLQQKWLREYGHIEEADDLSAEISSITERIDTD